MKKFLMFISTLILSLIFVNNKTFAQSTPYIYKTIDFVDFMDSEGWEIVSIGNQAFTATGVLKVPGIDTSIAINDAIELHKRMPHSLEKGTPHTSFQRYVFSELPDEPEKVRLDISLNKMNYTNWCLNTGAQCDGDNPDPTTLHYYMSEYFAGYYVSNVPSPLATEYKSIDFNDVRNWALLSIDDNTFTVSTILELPEIVDGVHPNEVIEMYISLALNLNKSEPSPMYSNYIFEPTDEPEEVILKMSVNKFYYNDWCTRNDLQCSGDTPDLTTFYLYMSEYFAGYYIIRFPIDYEYPDITIKLNPSNVIFDQENEYTYEYRIYYNVSNNAYPGIDINEYFLITYFYTPMFRGLYRNFNSYEVTEVNSPPQLPYTIIELTVTLLKDFVDENYTNDPNDSNYIDNFFNNDSAFYVSYIGNTSSIDYSTGYENGFNDGFNDGRVIGDSEGYNRGYNAGYSEGYNVGYRNGMLITEQEAYQRGYEDGINSAVAKPLSNLHIWLVPAIIIVVIAGIFVGYRRERHWND